MIPWSVASKLSHFAAYYLHFMLWKCFPRSHFAVQLRSYGRNCWLLELREY